MKQSGSDWGWPQMRLMRVLGIFSDQTTAAVKQGLSKISSFLFPVCKRRSWSQSDNRCNRSEDRHREEGRLPIPHSWQPVFFLDASWIQTLILQKDGKEHGLASCVGRGKSPVTPEPLLRQLANILIQYIWNNGCCKRSDRNHIKLRPSVCVGISPTCLIK